MAQPVVVSLVCSTLVFIHFGVAQLQVRVRAINRGKCPVTLFNLPDRLFKQNCRFDKATVRRITSYLHRFLAKPNSRGSPLSPEDLVATALLQLS